MTSSNNEKEVVTMIHIYEDLFGDRCIRINVNKKSIKFSFHNGRLLPIKLDESVSRNIGYKHIYDSGYKKHKRKEQ